MVGFEKRSEPQFASRRSSLRRVVAVDSRLHGARGHHFQLGALSIALEAHREGNGRDLAGYTVFTPDTLEPRGRGDDDDAFACVRSRRWIFFAARAIASARSCEL